MFLRKGVVWKNYDRESVLYDLEKTKFPEYDKRH